MKKYSVKIIKDSYCLETGCRITTWIQVHPYFIHQDFMTHRVMSRNAASLRAIPIQKVLKSVIDNPAIPTFWGKNQPGMKARQELTGWRKWLAIKLWLLARYPAVAFSWLLFKIGLHKQLANRIVMPWFWITVIVTATEKDNYLLLRDHPDAQPEIALPAKLLREALEKSTPEILEVGEWHLPFIDEEEKPWPLERKLKVSAGRCARVSYENHFGIRDPEDDVRLFNDLNGDPPHLSPMEHQAEAMGRDLFYKNFMGWQQFRSYIEWGKMPESKTRYSVIDMN